MIFLEQSLAWQSHTELGPSVGHWQLFLCKHQETCRILCKFQHVLHMGMLKRVINNQSEGYLRTKGSNLSFKVQRVARLAGNFATCWMIHFGSKFCTLFNSFSLVNAKWAFELNFLAALIIAVHCSQFAIWLFNVVPGSSIQVVTLQCKFETRKTLNEELQSALCSGEEQSWL